MKRRIMMACLALLQLLATGCAGAGITPAATNSEQLAVNEKETAVFWTYMPDYEKKMIDQYNLLYRDIHISPVYVAAGEVLLKFATVWAADGDIPDIITFKNSNIHDLRKLHRLDDLSKSPYNFDTGKVLDNLSALVKDESGTVIGIPQSPSPYALVYRRDLVNEYLGTDKPEELKAMIDTWEKFIEAAVTIKQKSAGKVYALASLEGLWQIIYGQNGKPVVEDGRTRILQNYLQDFDFIRKVAGYGVSQNLKSGSQLEKETYKNGSVIFFPIPAWGLQLFVENYDKPGTGRWDIVSAPGGACEYGGNVLGIPSKARHKQTAWNYLNWAYGSRAGNALMAKSNKILPILKECYDENLERESPRICGTNLASFWMEEMKNIRSKPLTAYSAYLNEIMPMELRIMAISDTSAEEMCGRIIKKMKNKFPELVE